MTERQSWARTSAQTMSPAHEIACTQKNTPLFFDPSKKHKESFRRALFFFYVRKKGAAAADWLRVHTKKKRNGGNLSRDKCMRTIDALFFC